MVKICLLFVLTWREFFKLLQWYKKNFDVISFGKNGNFCYVLCYSANI